jgi:hypothetical protein
MSKSIEFIYNLDKYKDVELNTLRNLLFPNQNIILSDKFDSYDCYIPDKKIIVELKNRDMDIDYFDKHFNGVMLLEKYKCDAMLELLNTPKFSGYLACYVYVFRDGWCQYIILNRLDFTKINYSEERVPKNSFVKNSPYIKKNVYSILKRYLTPTNHRRFKL